MHLRRKYQKGQLTATEIKVMEAVIFQWKILDCFERGLDETLRHKAMTGHPSALREYKTPDGFKLGRWQHAIHLPKGRFSKKHIRRLTKIGFVWHLIKEAYRRGIEETRKYRKKHGTANCPVKYITADGYRLGEWQSRIKQRRKKRKLSPKTIKELETLGVEWGKRQESRLKD